MVIDIIRNCSHYSDVITGIFEENGDDKIVLKSSYTQKGVGELMHELRGIRWFCNKIGVSVESIILDEKIRKSYAMLKLRYVEGEMGDCLAGVAKNRIRLINALSFYVENIHDSDLVVSHGDFSVSNIVFDESHAVKWVIDWENNMTSLPSGYDLVYMVTELALFEMVKKGKVSGKSLAVYWEFVDRLAVELKIDFSIFKAPGKWLRSNVIQSIEAGRSDMRKCPFVANSITVIDALDAELNSSGKSSSVVLVD